MFKKFSSHPIIITLFRFFCLNQKMDPILYLSLPLIIFHKLPAGSLKSRFFSSCGSPLVSAPPLSCNHFIPNDFSSISSIWSSYLPESSSIFSKVRATAKYGTLERDERAFSRPSIYSDTFLHSQQEAESTVRSKR